MVTVKEVSTKKEMKTIEKKSTIPVFLEGLYEPMLKKGIISPPGLLESHLPTKPRKTIISTDPPVQEELKETNDILFLSKMSLVFL